MFGLKSTLCFVFVAVCFAPSHQKPAGENVDTLNKAVENLLTNDGKVNNSDAASMPMAVDKIRSAVYPNSAGLGYYNLGQTHFPIQHYSFGHQMYQAPILSSSMYKNEDAARTDPRTLGLSHGLKPMLYSQYQSVPLVPQMYSYPAQSYHVQPHSYEYSSPMISGLSNHYTSYSSYPYLRDVEEEKPRQFSTLMPTEKFISSVRPTVQYTSKYLMGKPLENYENFFQPQIMQPISMASPLLVRNAMPGEWNQPQERAFTTDEQLQLQNPQSYQLEKLQQYAPSNEVRSPVIAQPPITRATEESKPIDWSPTFFSQPLGYKNGGLAQVVPDPYISPEDSVYVEPYATGEPIHHLPGSRSVEPMMMGTFPNHEQQLRIAQMQYYHNAMNNAADHIEPINKEYVSQRMFLPNYPTQMDPLSTQRTFFPNTQAIMESRSIEDHQNLFSQVEGIKKNVETLIEANKLEKKKVSNDTLKEPKNEQNTTGSRPGDVGGTNANAQVKH